jgi:hypothetical protein
LEPGSSDVAVAIPLVLPPTESRTPLVAICRGTSDERKRMLRRLIRGGKHSRLMYAHDVKSRGCELFQLICEQNLEGIVAKHKNGLYGPSAKWIKIRNPNYTQAEGRHELFESLRSARSALFKPSFPPHKQIPMNRMQFASC